MIFAVSSLEGYNGKRNSIASQDDIFKVGSIDFNDKLVLTYNGPLYQ